MRLVVPHCPLNAQERDAAHALWSTLMMATTCVELEMAAIELNNAAPKVRLAVNLAIAEFWEEGRQKANRETNPFDASLSR